MISRAACLVSSIAWISLFAVGLPGSALAEDQSTGQRTLTLTGQGEASAAPDLAWLRIGVATEAEQAQEALRANAEAMTKVIAALKSDGLAGKDLQTSNLSIAPQYPADPKKPRVIVGYRVSNMLTVRIRDLGKTGAIVDQAVGLGSNEIADLAFDIDDPAAVQNEARTAAVRDAIAKAKLYAGAAGLELGPIIRISEETPNNFPPMVRQLRAAPAGAASTPVEAGELTYRALVDITWSIR